MALKTAETVGMYSVLFLARSQVRPISWQSLLNILLALSSLVLLSCVPFLAFSCKNNHIQDCFSHKKIMHKRWKKKGFLNKVEYQRGKAVFEELDNQIVCSVKGSVGGHMGLGPMGRVTFSGSTLESFGGFSQNSKKKTLKVNLHCPTFTFMLLLLLIQVLLSLCNALVNTYLKAQLL